MFQTQDLELGIVGNCVVNAMIDKQGSIVFACFPRPDSDPVFNKLLDRTRADNGTAASFDVSVEGQTSTTQAYLGATAILKTTLHRGDHPALEIIDFAPRLANSNAVNAQPSVVRIIRPVSAPCRVQIRCTPSFDYGETSPSRELNSGSVCFRVPQKQIWLQASIDPTPLLDGAEFILDRPIACIVGSSFHPADDLLLLAEYWLTETEREWKAWVAGLRFPTKETEAAIRAAIGLRLHWYEPTGAVLAALSLGIPAESNSNRNWDYRYCWLRDAFYTVRSLTRLGDRQVLKGFADFLRPIAEEAINGPVQCLYCVDGSLEAEERVASSLSGYRGLGPVLIGNAAVEQTQLDCFGHILNVFALLSENEGEVSGTDIEICRKLAAQAWKNYRTPDAGFWELRGSERVHTYSAIVSWDALRAMAEMCRRTDDPDEASVWAERAEICRDYVLSAAWSEKESAIAGYFGGDALDVTVLYAADVGMISSMDSRFRQTIEAIERRLLREDFLLPYDEEDDFGNRECGFNLCTFWFINSLYRIGRSSDAEKMLGMLLLCRNDVGYLSEVIEPKTKELWGNYPQAYSLSGIIDSLIIFDAQPSIETERSIALAGSEKS